MALVKGLTVEHGQTIAMVGVGAILGGAAQASGIGVSTVGENLRDVIVVGLGAWGMAMGGKHTRSLAAGFGAAGVVGLIARNFPQLAQLGG